MRPGTKLPLTATTGSVVDNFSATGERVDSVTNSEPTSTVVAAAAAHPHSSNRDINRRQSPPVIKPANPTGGIVNPVFVSDLVPSGSSSPVTNADVAVGLSSSSSLESTVIVHHRDHRHHHQLSPSCTPPSPRHSASNQRTLTTGSADTRPSSNTSVPYRCVDCYRFHVNHHRHQESFNSGHRTAVKSLASSHSPVSISPNLHRHRLHPPQRFSPGVVVPPYAPYPPQWYYLLGADLKKFHKHRHTHYRKNCKTCRDIVRQTFELYYLQNGAGGMAPSSVLAGKHRVGLTNDQTDRHSSTDSAHSNGTVESSRHNHYDPLLGPATARPFASYIPPLMSGSFLMSRNRANCGHSFLKYSILFYCSMAVILSICFICYLTKMFGYLRTELDVAPSSNSIYSNTFATLDQLDSIPMNASDLVLSSATGNHSDFGVGVDSSSSPSSVLEMIRMEVVGIIVCSAFMIIFFLGLIGTFLESVLCLRIFGAILSYLFLLTFGGALYVIILLVISNVPLKLILSTVSCAAVAITIHALLAIAPFAFADLIYQDNKQAELNSTYFKYPSVRFLPTVHTNFGAPKRGRSYFSLGPLGRVWSRSVMGQTMHQPPPPSSHEQQSAKVGRASSTSAATNSPRNTTPIQSGTGDNLSSEGLLPPMRTGAVNSSQHGNMVRFNDNWI